MRAMGLSGLSLLLLSSYASAQPLVQERLRIHPGNGEPVSFALSEIDSVTFVDVDVPPGTVFVPAGRYVKGDAIHVPAIEWPTTLTHDFFLGRHEVTNREYAEALQWAYDQGLVVLAGDHVVDMIPPGGRPVLDLTNPACEIGAVADSFVVRDVGHGVNPEHPVQGLPWWGAVCYCEWLNVQEGLPPVYDHGEGQLCNGGDPYRARGYRLPTDAEWEYAAQFNDDREYPWGDALPDCGRANTSGCVGWTLPVGSLPAGTSAVGLWDMAGNAWEWVDDSEPQSYDEVVLTDPASQGRIQRFIVRGASWDAGPETARCTSWEGVEHGFERLDAAGFRVARTVDP